LLSAVADALLLDPAERRQSLRLNDRPPPEPRPTGPERVEAPLRAMLDSLAHQLPMCSAGAGTCWRGIGAAEVLFGIMASLEGDERNIMHICSPTRHTGGCSSIGRTSAATVLAMFGRRARATGAQLRSLITPAWARLSPEFRELWSRQV